MPALMK